MSGESAVRCVAMRPSGNAREGGEGGSGSPAVRELGADGGGYGRRVRGSGAASASVQTGKKRGRPPKTADGAVVGEECRARRTAAKRTLWTDTGREEYNRTVNKGNRGLSSEREGRVGQRFERGEGGGVT